jgi:hypothetical protein
VVTVVVVASVVCPITVTTSGAGYAVGDILTIAAGALGDDSTIRTFTLVADDLLAGTITGITVTTIGTGYKVGDSINIGATWDGSSASQVTLVLEDDDFTANQFDWKACPRGAGCISETWSSPLVTIVAGTDFELGANSGVFVTFSSSDIHELHDQWNFVAIGDNNHGTANMKALQTGAAFAVTMDRSGETPVGQISVAPGYKGTATGAVNVYKVPPTFTVQAQTVQNMQIVTNLNSNSNGGPSFKFDHTDSQGTTTVSPCWAYDAEEYVVAAALRDPVLNLCPTYALTQADMFSSVTANVGDLTLAEVGPLDLTADDLKASMTDNSLTDCSDATYTGVALSSLSGSGAGAVVDVVVVASVVSTITVTTSGAGYATGDILTIAAGALGGTSTIRTFTLVADDLIVSGTFTNVDITATGLGLGFGAKATVAVAAGSVTSAIVTLEGSGYADGDVVSIAAADIGDIGGGGSDVTFTLQVADLEAEKDGCVSVTRSIDNVNNVGGFVYNIYYDDASFAYNLDEAHMEINVYKNHNTCGSTVEIDQAFARATASLAFPEITPTWEETSDKHGIFTRLSIPLGTVADPDVPASFRGIDVSGQKLYKTNGNLWAVTFATALGDVDAMTATGTSYLTAGTSLSVYDDVVQGKHPETHSLTDLSTGIDYSVRVAAYTRGTFHGYSAFTDTSVTVGGAVASSSTQLGLTTLSYTSAPTYAAAGVPSEKPPALAGFTAVETLQVSEVQDIVVGASHLREVQTITTDASVYAEVQSITTSADNLETITGSMTMRFPEVQTIQLTAVDTTNMAGWFEIEYWNYASVSATSATLHGTSACLPVTASADDVKLALEAITDIDGVRVVRAGYGGYTDYFGYTWSISFTGTKVAGNVEELVVNTWDSSDCSTGSGLGPSATITTLNENEAVGLNTEVHTLQLVATEAIAQGQFKVRLNDVGGGVATDWNSACLAWNSTALQLQTALESIPKIDHVFVERFGSAAAVDETWGNHGYTYSIFYTGNKLTAGNHLSATTVGILEVEEGAAASCDTFAYFDNGVKTDFAAADAAFTAVEIRDTDFTLNVAATTATVLADDLKVMPTWVQVDDVRVTAADDQGGHTWTVVFDEAMGNVNQLVCGFDAAASPGTVTGFACDDKTVIDGNYIGGYFVVGTSKLVSASASAADMKTALEALTGFGTIAVTRSDASNQGGYTWTITWLDAIGNQDPLTFANSLTGSGTSINGATLQEGNYLGGTYQLEYQGLVTDAISFDATASELDALLTAKFGAVTVTQGSISTEGGSTYTVTFDALTGDISALVPQFDGQLTGVGAVVSVITTTQGADATGTALKVSFETPMFCSHSQVPSGECGDSVDSYSVEIGTTAENKNQVVPLTASYTVQLDSSSSRTTALLLVPSTLVPLPLMYAMLWNHCPM